MCVASEGVCGRYVLVSTLLYLRLMCSLLARRPLASMLFCQHTVPPAGVVQLAWWLGVNDETREHGSGNVLTAALIRASRQTADIRNRKSSLGALRARGQVVFDETIVSVQCTFTYARLNQVVYQRSYVADVSSSFFARGSGMQTILSSHDKSSAPRTHVYFHTYR